MAMKVMEENFAGRRLLVRLIKILQIPRAIEGISCSLLNRPQWKTLDQEPGS